MTLALAISDRLQQLPERRRRLVEEGLNRFAEELVERSAEVGDLKKIEAASRAAVDAVDVLMFGRREELERLQELLAELRSRLDADGMELMELEASGRLQLLALYRGVEEESLSVAELEEVGISRQRLKQLRDEGRLLGILLPFRRGYLYPSWQFQEDLTPLSFLPELLEVAAEEDIDPLTVHRLLTNRPAGDGATPLQLCEEGRVDLARNLLRAHGQSGG